jgi:hypothetical protein
VRETGVLLLDGTMPSNECATTHKTPPDSRVLLSAGEEMVARAAD